MRGVGGKVGVNELSKLRSFDQIFPMISLVIIVEVAEGKADLFAEYIAEEARDVMANEPGCRSFVVSRSVEDPHTFTLAEVYDDQAALDQHRLTPHFLLFQERVREHGLIAKKSPVWGEVIFP
jgi:autoinducer 2-degrading protein